MWVKVTTLSFQCRDKLNFTTMPENIPIMLALCLMLARPYYAPNYAGIIRPSLPRVRITETASFFLFFFSFFFFVLLFRFFSP